MPRSTRPTFDLSQFADLPVSTKGDSIKPTSVREHLERGGGARAKRGASSYPRENQVVLVLFGLDAVTSRACERVAMAMGVVVIRARDLFVACRAMEKQNGAIVFGSASIPAWDRHVVRDRAAAAEIDVHWFEHGESDPAAKVREHLVAALRPRHR